ncbi:DUF3955 domain-containing protein [Lachnoclostridium phytofermentans]|uniref:Uncharacterized protein n=1 Tax=Lachnoclostridium phytofermentans (strain ATCC 700394 / DSM 18823 / ISDg) TaxID=357809 RepID=A9KQX6_LACP7|nr:DUF3955 domain-containing protein [Lachnoclostridium phytofermentans]ABX43455.1 hypothetical protein Cphy_3099 [Lachnoclostridium phytofermentans ISDg]
MNKSCDIVRDLIPLYIDNVCSQESRKFVEEHVEHCESCKEELSKNRIEFESMTFKTDKEEVEAMKNIAHKWKKDRKISFMKGIFFTSLLATVACPILFNIIGSKVLEDGTLVEPFALIPLAYLFLLITIISGIIIALKSRIKRMK